MSFKCILHPPKSHARWSRDNGDELKLNYAALDFWDEPLISNKVRVRVTPDMSLSR